MVEPDSVLTASFFNARVFLLCMFLTTLRCATTALVPILPANPTFRALVEVPLVHDCFADVLRRGLRRQESENAAWVVLRRDHYECVAWDATGYRSEVTFKGEIPIGVVAIVHSHPPSQPKASMQDLETAKRLNVPIFAVTPLEVWVADPDVGIAPVVRNVVWAHPSFVSSAGQW